jgi:Mlc titration factor MtfA (ptsG expression regulator)
MSWFAERRRRRAKAADFPASWSEIVDRNVPYQRRLSAEDRAELRGDVQVFLAEKTFEGCGGLVVTDEIRVTIAAQACLLLLHRETDDYPLLRSILVYPSAYVAPLKEPDEGGVIREGTSVRLGESWGRGTVVLSWDDVLRGAADIHDGQNVVLHEFAHQLDQEGGSVGGAPLLPRRSMYVAWARVLGAEYARLRDDSARGKSGVLREYGATNPAEFFAVATECFFEKGAALRAKHPELYDELKLYYRQDPAELRDPGAR